MRVYTFNLNIGYLPNGVDNAQGYRAQLLKDYCQQFYIFTKPIPYKTYQYYTNLGIEHEMIACIPYSFTDHIQYNPTCSYEDILKLLPTSLDIDIQEQKVIARKDRARWEIILNEDNKVLEVLHFVNNYLLQKDVYGNGKLYSEMYNPEQTENGLFAIARKRNYFNQDGSVVLEEFLDDCSQWLYLGQLLTDEQLLVKYLNNQKLTKQDVLLLDRSTHMYFSSVLLEYKGQARIYHVLHSLHEIDNDLDIHYWKGFNYEYNFLYQYIDKFDGVICATKNQAKDLKTYFRKKKKFSVPVYTIPVGYLKDISPIHTNIKPYSLVSVSRLDQRKNVDYLIDSIALVHQRLPEIHLDIYGTGTSEYIEYLKDKIHQLEADDYIQLKGYVTNFDLYDQYEVYVSLSLWETFGLTLMEAIGSGCAMVGMNVPYGNQTFIQPGKNGCLVDFDETIPVKEIADSIINMYAGDIKTMRMSSNKLAKEYQKDEVFRKWIDLLEGDDGYNL